MCSLGQSGPYLKLFWCSGDHCWWSPPDLLLNLWYWSHPGVKVLLKGTVKSPKRKEITGVISWLIAVWEQLLHRCHCCSVTKSCLTLYNPMDCSIPGCPVLHYFPEFSQSHVHWVGDAIQSSHLLLPPSLALNLSQYQGLFQWIGSSLRVAKVLELHLQH